MKALTSLLLFAIAVHAQTNWKLDKAHSEVTFKVKHLLFSDVSGRFGDFSATIQTPTATFADPSIEFSVMTKTIDTNNERRDGHLRSDDFFNSEKFPMMKFVSTGMKSTGDKTYDLMGKLTIRDVTKDVTFKVTKVGSLGPIEMFNAKLTINRFDYNLKWNRAIETGGLVVGEDVRIELNLQIKKG